MAKVSPEKWKKAEALRKAGKSYRAISKELDIPTTTLVDRAKREDWDSNKTEQLIIDAVRVEGEIRSLETEQARVVREEVQKQLDEAEKKRKYQEFLENATHKNLTHMMRKVISYKDQNGIVIDPTASVSEHVQAQNALNRGAELLIGKNPDTVINNTNAQKNNQDKRRVFHVVE